MQFSTLFHQPGKRKNQHIWILYILNGSDNEFDKDVDSPDPVEQPEGHQEERKQESDQASEKVDSGQRSSWTSVRIKEGENLAECISNCMSYL